MAIEKIYHKKSFFSNDCLFPNREIKSQRVSGPSLLFMIASESGPSLLFMIASGSGPTLLFMIASESGPSLLF